MQETDADGAVTLHEHLPRRLLGTLAAHPLRGLLQPGRGHEGDRQAAHLAARPARSACKLVYATDGYGASVSNLAQTSLATDNVFSDGWSLQLATVTGDVTKGMTATLNVPV